MMRTRAQQRTAAQAVAGSPAPAVAAAAPQAPLQFRFPPIQHQGPVPEPTEADHQIGDAAAVALEVLLNSDSQANSAITKLISDKIAERLAQVTSAPPVAPLSVFKTGSSMTPVSTYKDEPLRLLQKVAIGLQAAAAQTAAIADSPNPANIATLKQTAAVMQRTAEVLAVGVDVAHTSTDTSVPSAHIVAATYEALEAQILDPHPKVLSGQKRLGEMDLTCRDQLVRLAKLRSGVQNPTVANMHTASAPSGAGPPTPFFPMEQGHWPGPMAMPMPMQQQYQLQQLPFMPTGNPFRYERPNFGGGNHGGGKRPKTGAGST